MRARVCASKRFAGAGRADQHDVRLGQLDAVAGFLAVHEDALVVVVDGDCQLLLGLLLADDVLVEEGFHFLRLGQLVRSAVGGVAVRSSSRMELHTATHSSQM